MELNCVCARMRQVSRVVTQLYDRALEPSGLTAMQFAILMTLHGMGDARLTQIARGLKLDQTTATRSLKLMKDQGWVKERTAEDGRAKTLKLTHSGRAVLDKAQPLWQGVQSKMLARMGQGEWDRLKTALDGVVAD